MGLNVFTFSGNLGKDCRKATTQGGTAVCGFPVAVKAGYGDKEQTIWVDCSIWGKRAESGLPDYLVKGQKVMVSGELGTREHEGKTYLTCKVAEIDLAGGKSEAQQGNQPAQQEDYRGHPGSNQPNPTYGKADPGFDNFDDDIPF